MEQTTNTTPKAKSAKVWRGLQIQHYSVWTYDVWGNARDGYDVNDRCCVARDVEIRVRGEVCNAGTPHEFVAFAPTDRQLSQAAGFRNVTWEGEPGFSFTAETRNGRPVGELVRVMD